MAAEQQPAASWGADTDGRLNQPSEHLTHHAMWQADASGNVTGLVGPGGILLKGLYPFDVKHYGAKCDGRAMYDASMASGSNIINSASASFTADDVGKVVAIGPMVETRNWWKTGTVLQVNSASQIVVSVSAAQDYSGAYLILGTDDADALDVAMSACSLSGGGAVTIIGMCCTSRHHVIPNGVVLEGNGAITPPNGLSSIYYRGSSLIRMGYSANFFITVGESHASNNRAAGIYGLTIDGMDNYGTVACSGVGANLIESAFLGGAGTTVNGVASTTIDSCYIVGDISAPNSGVLHISGDMKVINNQIYGVGAGKMVVLVDGNGALCIGNHIYAGSSTYAARTGGVYLSSSSGRKGANVIANNMIDSPYGPAFTIDVAGAGYVNANNVISGNTCYQNDLVPAGQHSWLKIKSSAGGVLLGNNISGNTAKASWQTPSTYGTWNYGVDLSEHAGTMTGNQISNNVITDVVNGHGMYSGGSTPSGVNSANNVIVNIDGTTTVY